MQYIGIDLGTTNSAICSFDGMDTHIWQSPDQTTVTPSAIYTDRRGNRYYGRRAYEMAPMDEKNSATLFKRYMGTSRKFTFERTGETLTPEECSAEILRVLYGYLPEDWQGKPDTFTVITVPAAFGQVKKDATLEAARKAKIGNVALIQEPVAAVMSAMKEKKIEGAFLIYDLGGGTFDASVAEYMSGKVRLLAQGGKEMCGGRDWDRSMMRSLVTPWLRQNFNLPEDMERNGEYRRLRQLALFACERAKITLSQVTETVIQMPEENIQTRDLDGKEIYLEVPVSRAQLDGLIQDQIQTTIQTAREVIKKSGLQQIQTIVFIGGPTVYPSVQTRVMNALRITDKGRADPMTAVAEGAAIFAESINWESADHQRQESIRRAEEKDFEIRYESRSAEPEARIALIHRQGEPFSAEVISERDGWSSGRAEFAGRGMINVPLRQRGENRFDLKLYDGNGLPVKMENRLIRIQYVLASVAEVPSSHAIAIKALDSVGGKPVPVYLVQENEALPKRGSVTLRAGIRLIAGSENSIVFTLWEGEIRDPVDDNRYIGTYRIPGESFGSGVVQEGAEIICDYEINESGNLTLGVTIPSVGAAFANQNYYSRAGGELNLEDTDRWMKETRKLEDRVKEIIMNSGTAGFELRELMPRLSEVKAELESGDPENIHLAIERLMECQKKTALFCQEHQENIRVIELNNLRTILRVYENDLSKENQEALEALYVSAREAIDFEPESYNSRLRLYNQKAWQMLIDSETFLRDQVAFLIQKPEDFYTDKKKFLALRAQGQTCIENGEYKKLLSVLIGLNMIQKRDAAEDTSKMFENVNVIRN